jgi:hypothetical protein
VHLVFIGVARGFEANGSVALARSSLRRLTRRLRAALDRLMAVFGKSRRSVLDYESLMSLSHASGLEAVRTMTDLSARVSVRSSSPMGGRTSMSKRSISGGKSSRASKHRSSSGTGKSRSSHSSERHAQPSSRRRLSKQSSDPVRRRASMMTSSSDSTKLGEIRRERARDSEQTYNAKVAYPLHGYSQNAPASGKKKWFGLFGRH